MIDTERWQSLMNEAYELWRNENWSKSKFLTMISPLQRTAVILGNLNYQVHNGGFSQWIFNGYSKAGRIFFEEVFSLLSSGAAKRVEEMIYEAMHIVEEQESDGEYEEDNGALDTLDTEFYSINDEFQADIASTIKKLSQFPFLLRPEGRSCPFRPNGEIK